MLGKSCNEVGTWTESPEAALWVTLPIPASLSANTLDLENGNDVWCCDSGGYNRLKLVLSAEETVGAFPCSEFKPLCTETV
uniref:Phytochrome-interacting factor 3 family protein n=1 Tax=Rhizophora mucronata TaxID=61149 RepID=A0A2P2KDW5_RHIMU